jgi:hypothetical protein
MQGHQLEYREAMYSAPSIHSARLFQKSAKKPAIVTIDLMPDHLVKYAVAGVFA